MAHVDTYKSVTPSSLASTPLNIESVYTYRLARIVESKKQDLRILVHQA